MSRLGERVFEGRRALPVWTWTLAAFALGSLLMVDQARAETAWEKIERTGVITYANGSNYPPMEFMQDGKNVGFNIDMGEEIAKRLGKKAEWVIVEFKGIIATLKSGRVDVINSSMTITMGRAKEVTFTRGYVDFGIAAVHAADVPIVFHPADAKGKIVGVEVGTAGEAWARENLKDAKDIRAYEQLILAMRDLGYGRVDLVVNNKPALAYTMKMVGAGAKPLAITPVWDKRVAGLAVRHGEGELLVKLNEAIDGMEKDGYLAGLRKKWFGE
jgi:polar amino acid transport system substrate-binding protein